MTQGAGKLITMRITTTPRSIKDQSGKLFDPQVVDALLAIYDVITAIRDKYPEEGSPSSLVPSS